MTRKTDPATLDHAVALYLSGKSVLECSTLLGVGRNPIAVELRRRGIEPRGSHDAAVLRYAGTTVEERAAITAAANVAARGRKARPDEAVKRALTNERSPKPMSVHEAQFARLLDAQRVEWQREIACGPYNIDFIVGPVAVEILGGSWHAQKTARHARRSEHILNAGWTLCYVWSTVNWPLTSKAAEYVVALADQASRNPALVGEYRVIRGDAHEIAAGRGQLDNLTNELLPRGSLNPEEQARRASLIRWHGHEGSTDHA